MCVYIYVLVVLSTSIVLPLLIDPFLGRVASVSWGGGLCHGASAGDPSPLRARGGPQRTKHMGHN